MDTDKKLDFVLKMTKHALTHVQHLDQGGDIYGTDNRPSGYRPITQPGSPGYTSDSFNQNGQNQQFNYQNGLANADGSRLAPPPPGPVLAPTTQIDYTGANSRALQNVQSGLNQSQGVLGQQQGLIGQQQGVLGQQQNLAGQQQGLANQLQAQANGQGPNVSQNQLNATTGQNIAQQAALAASVRGAGSNAGLIAAQNAGQGANIQQQAIGQAATLRAQQQIAAQNALGQQQQGQLANSNSQNNTLAGIQGNLQGQVGAIQNEQGIQGNIYGASANANNAQNNTAVSNYGQMQGNATQLQVAGKQADSSLFGGLLSGVGSALSFIPGLGKAGAAASTVAKGAEGGMVLPDHLKSLASIYHPHMADGGEVADAPAQDAPQQTNLGIESPDAPQVNIPKAQAPKSDGVGDFFKAVGTGLSLLLLKDGGKVPGKPKVAHDDYDNDTVPVMLTPGEVVMDLDTLKDKGKLGKMARFVAENIERKKAGRKLT